MRRFVSSSYRAETFFRAAASSPQALPRAMSSRQGSGMGPQFPHSTQASLRKMNFGMASPPFVRNRAKTSGWAAREMKRAWLLSYWDIYIERMPKLCERLTIGTCPHAFRGVLAHRNFWIKDEAGTYILRADSLWFCYDTERMRPAKITEDMLTPFGEMRDVLALPASERKITEPEVLTEAAPILVQPHHIDSNHHVNNAQYIAIADEVLTEAAGGQERFHAGRIRAEYRKAAVLGDTMLPKYGSSPDGGRIVSLQSPAGEVYCNVEFIRN